MKSAIIVTFLLFLAGCSVKHIPRQAYIDIINEGEIAHMMIMEAPELYKCYGDDYDLSLFELDKAFFTATEIFKDKLPPMIDKASVTSTSRPIVEKAAALYIEHNQKRFTVSGLDPLNTKRCLTFHANTKKLYNVARR